MSSIPPQHDPVRRAHLTGRDAPTPVVRAYPAAPDLSDLVRRYWIPCWDLPEGGDQIQRVLQHPVCLIVISHDYARFYGVATGLSTVALRGRGFAVGTMLQPAAGRLLLGRSVETVTDQHVPLESLPTLDGHALRDRVRAAMAEAPGEEASHTSAIAAVEEVLRPHAAIDAEGRRINGIVARVEEDRDIRTVADLAAAEAMSERALQRLTRERLGLSPRWLIRRRRLHDAVARLKSGSVRLADLAAELGYSDQAHLTHDFQRATGTTPGAYLAQQQEQAP